MLWFLVLTFALSWTCWAASTLLPSGLGSVVFLLGVFAPGLVALAISRQPLLSGILRWRVAVGWYVFAVLYIVAIKFMASLIYRVAYSAWPVFDFSLWYLMPFGIFISMWAQAGEEVGWRGYALPRLTPHLGLGFASIVVGVIWATWHLPLFYIEATKPQYQDFPVYLVQVTALSVAIGWLYWRTNGSLLLVMLMHSAVNNTPHLKPPASALMAWLVAGLLWLGAACFLPGMQRVRTTSDLVPGLKLD